MERAPNQLAWNERRINWPLATVCHTCSTVVVAGAEVSGSVTLGDGTWLGPRVAINQGLTLGPCRYVGTGAVVTRDLPAHSLAYGSPAKVRAKVCACRNKLRFTGAVATSTDCGRTYSDIAPI